MLRVKLFGPGQAAYQGQPLVGFPNQQCYSLFCYLLLNRHHPHHRERLAAIFWDGYVTATSRKYLRNALWRLRQGLQTIDTPLDGFLQISDESISFLPTRDYWLDVEEFESTLALYQDRPGDQLTPEQAAELEGAADLYAGDLLEGVYEDWCLYDRERLRLLHLGVLSKLLAFHELNGTYERGLAVGNKILGYDHTRERVHRQIMRLHWLSGDRSAALAQYEHCVQILRQELGIPPMEKTKLLHRLMLHNQFHPKTWPLRQDDLLVDLPAADAPSHTLAQHAVQRLHRLQATIEESSSELRHIEQLIARALLNVRQS